MNKEALLAMSLVLWLPQMTTATGIGNPAMDLDAVQSDPDVQEMLLEGDILASPQQVQELYGSGRSSRAATVSSREQIWTGGVIPYVIHSCIDPQLSVIIQSAMKQWESGTCLKFVERNGQEDYVEFTCSSEAALCSSYVGRVGGRQTVQLGLDCKDKVLHEVGHTVGFWHEHSRADRDCFVEILRNNIEPSRYGEFTKLRKFIAQFSTAYDFGSIMHYRMDEFGNETSPGYRLQTMRVKNEKEYDSQGRPAIGLGRLSNFDLLRTNRLYNCPLKGMGVASHLRVHVRSGNLSTDFSSDY